MKINTVKILNKKKVNAWKSQIRDGWILWFSGITRLKQSLNFTSTSNSAVGKQANGRQLDLLVKRNVEQSISNLQDIKP